MHCRAMWFVLTACLSVVLCVNDHDEGVVLFNGEGEVQPLQNLFDRMFHVQAVGEMAAMKPSDEQTEGCATMLGEDGRQTPCEQEVPFFRELTLILTEPHMIELILCTHLVVSHTFALPQQTIWLTCPNKFVSAEEQAKGSRYGHGA